MSLTARTSILLCAQYMGAGRGGIGEVARMTARALSAARSTRALGCMDPSDFVCDTTPVRAFSGSRARFVANLAVAGRRATHIFYDFAGTARAQIVLAGSRRPYAVWAHGWEVWENPRPDYVKAIQRADLVLVNSAYTLERASAALKGAREVRLCPLATGSDEEPSHIGVSDSPPTVLLLGRIDDLLAKGHDILISIWPRVTAAVPAARLVFAGGGEAVGHVRGLAAASSAAALIDVPGFVPEDQLEAMWRRATLMAMPGFAEGFGLVYIEAMRRGLPVIASREDAGQEINVDGVTGFNISRQKPEALADAIITLLRDRDLAARMGQAGRQRWLSGYRFSNFSERLTAATKDFLTS